MKRLLKISMLTALCTTQALAADTEDYATYNTSPADTSGWGGYSVGFGTAFTPEYIGSDNLETSAMPLFSATYKINENSNITVGLPRTAYTYKHGAYKTGVALGYAGGRDSDDDRILTGLEDIDPYATVSPFVSYAFPNVGIFEVKPNFNLSDDVDGYTVDLSLSNKYQATEKLRFDYTLSTTYASDDYLDSNFSATANAGVGRAAYQADDAGFMRYGFDVRTTYAINRNSMVVLATGVDMLDGDAESASITQEEIQPKLAIGYVYRF